jgi:hypothetical protein
VDGCAFGDAVAGGGRLGDDGGACCYVGLGYDSGCGDGECVDVFDDAYADGCYAGGGGGEREAGEGGHDEAGGWCVDLFGFADEEADAGAQGAGVGVGGLGDDDAGFGICGDVGDDAEVEPETTDVDGGGAFALAEDVGDGDLLGAEAFGDADGPGMADGGAGAGRLGEDKTGRRSWRIEAVFEVDAEADGVGLLAGVGDGEASQVRYRDLAAMYGEPHGDESRYESHYKHGQGAEDEVEDTLHGLGQDTGLDLGMISLKGGSHPTST